MKVIFLDIDGVLNVIPQGFDKYGALFHQHFIDNLARLVKETGAKIVISSSWRYGNMKGMWKDRNLPGEVIGITPFEDQLIKKGKFKNYDEIFRGHEIEDWLDNHPEVTNYVILDDGEDFLLNQIKNHFVKTWGNWDHEDNIEGQGLTIRCVNLAINILNK